MRLKDGYYAGKNKVIEEEIYNQCKLELKKYGIRGEIGRRLQAIISAKEYSISKVAKIYRVTRTILMKWIAKFKEKDVIGFTIQLRHGPKAKLNEEKKEKIREIIEKERVNLTAKKLQVIVERMFAIKISESTAERLMEKLRFTYITPCPGHYKQDKNKQEKFKKNLNEIVEKNKKKKIFFFDESRFGTHLKVGHGWFKKGSRTQIKVKIGRENFYLYSAINPKNGEDVNLLVPHVNTDYMNIFLEQMSKDFRIREAFLIMNCASWHRSKDLKIPENITIIYLPPYLLELNPVERFWHI